MEGEKNSLHVSIISQVKFEVPQDGTSPLYMACHNGHEAVALLLLQNKADPDKAREVNSIRDCTQIKLLTYSWPLFCEHFIISDCCTSLK